SFTITAAGAGMHTFDDVILKTAGSQTITATDSVHSTITGSATVDVVAGSASQVAITSAPLSLIAGTPGQLTVRLEDSYGNPGATSPAGQTISLSTTGAAGAFSDSPTGGSPTTSVPIPAGQSSAGVYYSDTQAGTLTLKVS